MWKSAMIPPDRRLRTIQLTVTRLRHGLPRRRSINHSRIQPGLTRSSERVRVRVPTGALGKNLGELQDVPFGVDAVTMQQAAEFPSTVRRVHLHAEAGKGR